MDKRRRYTPILTLPNLTPRVLCIAEQPGEILSGILFSSTVAVNSGAAWILLRNQDFDVVLVSLPLADCAFGTDAAISPARFCSKSCSRRSRARPW